MGKILFTCSCSLGDSGHTEGSLGEGSGGLQVIPFFSKEGVSLLLSTLLLAKLLVLSSGHLALLERFVLVNQSF